MVIESALKSANFSDESADLRSYFVIVGRLTLLDMFDILEPTADWPSSRQPNFWCISFMLNFPFPFYPKRYGTCIAGEVTFLIYNLRFCLNDLSVIEVKHLQHPFSLAFLLSVVFQSDY